MSGNLKLCCPPGIWNKPLRTIQSQSSLECWPWHSVKTNPRAFSSGAAWLTNGTVLLVADLVLRHIANAVLASKLGGGVVAEPAPCLHPSSTGDGADVPRWPGTPASVDCQKANHMQTVRSTANTALVTEDPPTFVQETLLPWHVKNAWEEGEFGMACFLFFIKRNCWVCRNLFVSLESNLFPPRSTEQIGQMPGNQLGGAAHSPGQASRVQALVSRASPSQGLPFIWGLGELQSRILVITPSPHVTEQDDHGDQWLQPPSCLTEVQSWWLPGACQKPTPVLAALNALSHSIPQSNPIEQYYYPHLQIRRVSEGVDCSSLARYEVEVGFWPRV